MINPYYLYTVIFSFALIIYQFQWSELYPDLGIDLIFFITASSVIYFCTGKIYKPAISKFYTINCNHNCKKVVYLILTCWGIEFLYSKGIPLVSVLQGVEYDYTSFGIPSFHVFVSTFSSFYAVYLFHLYLSSKNRSFMIFSGYCIIPQLLMFSRGGILMIITSCIFIYIKSNNQSKKLASLTAKFSKLIILVFAILFAFGSLGNIRTEHAYQSSEENIILRIGKATSSFKESSIPTELFWFYLYTSSPLANLQTTIDSRLTTSSQININNIVSFVNNQLLPDFISKRLNQVFSSKGASISLMDQQFTVATVYAGSYAELGWIGMIIMNLLILLFPMVYSSFMRNQSQFGLTGMSILGSLYLFLIFDNMFTFSGLSLQLIYPLLLQKFEKFKISEG